MKLWETLGIVGVGVVTLAAILGALKDLVKVPGQLWSIFGWHGRFWAFLVRMVRAVDVIIAIPASLREIDSRVSCLESLVPKIEAIHYQLHPNGGGSAVDTLARVEQGVKGLYTPAITAPTTITPSSSKEATA